MIAGSSGWNSYQHYRFHTILLLHIDYFYNYYLLSVPIPNFPNSSFPRHHQRLYVAKPRAAQYKLQWCVLKKRRIPSVPRLVPCKSQTHMKVMQRPMKNSRNVLMSPPYTYPKLHHIVRMDSRICQQKSTTRSPHQLLIWRLKHPLAIHN